jgi:hypothetical protein
MKVKQLIKLLQDCNPEYAVDLKKLIATKHQNAHLVSLRVPLTSWAADDVTKSIVFYVDTTTELNYFGTLDSVEADITDHTEELKNEE